MPREQEKINAEYKAGIFIILTVIILIFSLLWLRYFSLRPEMTVVAKFDNPGPISKGLPVYYQGVNVGRLSQIKFSQNFKNTLIYLEIYKEGLKLPANVHAEILAEGITGQKYIAIVYPETPVPELLRDKDIIVGVSPFGLGEIQAFVEDQIKSGRITRILDETEKTLKVSTATLKELNQITKTTNQLLSENKGEINNFFNYGSKAAADLSGVMANVNNFVGNPKTKGDLRSAINSASNVAENINKLLGNPETQANFLSASRNLNEITASVNQFTGDPEVQQGLKSTIAGINSFFESENGIGIGAAIPPEAGETVKNFGSLLGNVNSFVKNLNYYTSQIYNDVQKTNLIENMSNTFEKASSTFDKTGNFIDKTGNVIDKAGALPEGQKFLGTLSQAVQSHNEAMARFNCVNKGLSEMLSKRFLLIKLLFGKPGESLDKCEKPEILGSKTEQNLQIPNNCIPVRPCPIK